MSARSPVRSVDVHPFRKPYQPGNKPSAVLAADSLFDHPRRIVRRYDDRRTVSRPSVDDGEYLLTNTIATFARSYSFATKVIDNEKISRNATGYCLSDAISATVAVFPSN